MKLHQLGVLISVLILAGAVPTVTRSATDARGRLGNLMPPSLNHTCVLFTLKDVAEADLINPGNPWFAIATTNPGFDKLYAMLVAVKSLTPNVQDLSQPNLIVQTTGNAACGGYAEVNYIYWTG